jgi:hypothetical protein
MHYLIITLQIIVALGIMNVWLLRASRATPYRGGSAKTIREEFVVYGLPHWFMCAVGTLKVALALALLVALKVGAIAAPAALILGLLMVGAIIMHLKVKDPLSKALPASVMLALCIAIIVLPRLSAF